MLRGNVLSAHQIFTLFLQHFSLVAIPLFSQ